MAKTQKCSPIERTTHVALFNLLLHLFELHDELGEEGLVVGRFHFGENFVPDESERAVQFGALTGRCGAFHYPERLPGGWTTARLVHFAFRGHGKTLLKREQTKKGYRTKNILEI